jgi:succinoglycan biosynthesis protein ExoM
MQRISVLLCTYRRQSVVETLASLARLRAPEGCFINIIVADNDARPSAEHLVREEPGSWPVTYVHAPAANISVARNACLSIARQRGSDWIAFIDDDEIAPEDWLLQLMACASDGQADVVSGPTLTRYPADAPAWMVAQDWHSNWPEIRRSATGEISPRQTAHSCNALVRFCGTPWSDVEFDLKRGTSGGEDTAYFFALSARGATFAVNPDAVVEEDVSADRLTLAWLARRRYRMGQSYASGTSGWAAKSRLIVLALAKVIYCLCAALMNGMSEGRRNYWILRGLLHVGVLSGCAALPQPQIYGQSNQSIRAPGE